MSTLIYQINATENSILFQRATIEFFAVHVRNSHTRVAYVAAVRSLMRYIQTVGIERVENIGSLDVAGWVSSLSGYAPTTVKQRLAAVNVYLDWLVANGVMEINPASSVRGPRYGISKGKTSALSPEEARTLLQSISCDTALGLRDRALIALMLFTFARIGACLGLVVGDVFTQNRRLWVRLNEKGGKLRDLPCHHQLEDILSTYMSTSLAGRPDTHVLFPSFDRVERCLSSRRLAHSNAYEMVRRRARQAGIATKVSNHSFRATGITSYLMNRGTLEMAAKLAGHASTTTTQLYDRRDDSVTLDEIERIRF